MEAVKVMGEGIKKYRSEVVNECLEVEKIRCDGLKRYSGNGSDEERCERVK